MTHLVGPLVAFSGSRTFTDDDERNERVVKGADRLIAFFSPLGRSPGTSDAIRIAERYSIPIDVYQDGTWSKH